ncbi:hypothetical protein IL306_008263, partial [Fusarium sp. DS 682]
MSRSPSSSASPSSGWSSNSVTSSSESHDALPCRTARPNLKPKPKSTFLFIDAQADNAKDSTVSKQKQAFLLKRYHREKKQASIDRLKAPKPPSKLLPLLGYLGPNHSAPENDKEHQEPENLHACPKQRAMRSEMWSLKAYLSQGYVDPFSSYAVLMTDSMNMYFHHLIKKTMRDSLHLRGNTLKTLNDLLQDPTKAVAESTTLIVASLVAIEAVDANFEALEAHTKGLKRLIHLMGGLDALDHMTLSKIYQSAVKSAALKNSRPVFPMLAKFRSEILQESKVFQPGNHFKVPLALVPLGGRFTDAPWYKDLHPTMQAFIEVFRRLILYFEIATMQPEVVMPTDNDLFLVVEHQLLSISYTPEGDDLNEPLRLSLLIYLNLRVWHFQTFPFMRYMVEALKQSLAPKLSHFQAAAPDLS